MRSYIIKDNQAYDVTELTTGVSWKYELDTLAGDLSVSVASDLFGVGNMFILKNGSTEIFRGVIVSESGRKVKDFNIIDLGWYLNKNELLIQFNKSTVYDAVISIVNKYGIAVELPDALKSATITKIYKDELVGDILRDLLDYATKVTNNRYHMRMIGSVLAIRTFHRDPIEIKEIGTDFELGKSIENMSNKVIVFSSEEKNKRIYADVSDDANIKKYGLLQTIETVEAEDLSKARNIAKNKLKELNRIEENISITCKGNFSILSGSRVQINDDPLKGLYLVKEVTHDYKNTLNYRSTLVLERWDNFVGK